MSYRRRIAAIALGAAALGLAGGGTARAECQFIPQDTPAGFFVIEVCAAETQHVDGNPEVSALIPVRVSFVGASQGALVGMSAGAQQSETTYDSGKHRRQTSFGPSAALIVPAAVAAGGSSIGAGFRQDHTQRADGTVRSTTQLGGDVNVVAPAVATSGANNASVYVRQQRTGDVCTQEASVQLYVADVPQGAVVPIGECAVEIPELPLAPAP